MKNVSLLSQLNSFSPEDGVNIHEWDSNFPIFEHFSIIGPKNYHKDIKPTVLYCYPDDSYKNIFNMEKFAFVDGLKYRNISLNDTVQIQTDFSSTPSIQDELIFLSNYNNITYYIYCIRFRANPFTRPALDDSSLLSDIIFYRNIGTGPSCLFAMCFVSTHPFNSLIFDLLKFMMLLESSSRIESGNLFYLASKDTPGSDPIGGTWPESSIMLREKFLSKLYDLSLPPMGEKLILSINSEEKIVWKMPHQCDIYSTITIWGCYPILNWIELNDFLSLLFDLLLEKYIVVSADSPNDVVRTVLFLTRILSPFSWVCPIMSVIPEELYDYIDTPMSSIIGICPKKPIELPENRVVIDLGQKLIKRTPNGYSDYSEIFGPLEEVLSPIWENRENGFPINLLNTIIRATYEFIECTILKPLFSSVMTKLGPKGIEGTQFIKGIFISHFSPKFVPFFEMIIETQLFTSMKEQVCRNKTMFSSDNEVEIQ